MAGLKELCYSELMSCLAINNCVRALNVAFKYDHKELQKRASKLISETKEEVKAMVKAMADFSVETQHIPEAVLRVLGIDESD